jgi:GntR family transcriptional repressor for pyruvate dehydrogenase complex
MAITAIKQKRISDEVFEQMKEHIISGDWAPGKKIPGELELVELFNVSRVSVREAIHRLVGMGVLTIRRGEGTFVTEMLPENYMNALLPILMIEGSSFSEMLEFRAIIEVESARLAARRADEQDFYRMEEVLQVMERCKGNNREFAKADLNFHVAVAMATHNSVIIKVNAIIHDMLKKMMEEIVAILWKNILQLSGKSTCKKQQYEDKFFQFQTSDVGMRPFEAFHPHKRILAVWDGHPQ